jgi:hypothetical protein
VVLPQRNSPVTSTIGQFFGTGAFGADAFAFIPFSPYLKNRIYNSFLSRLWPQQFASSVALTFWTFRSFYEAWFWAIFGAFSLLSTIWYLS